MKVVAWYDNEWGYSTRLVELAERVLVPVAAQVELCRRGRGGRRRRPPCRPLAGRRRLLWSGSKPSLRLDDRTGLASAGGSPRRERRRSGRWSRVTSSACVRGARTPPTRRSRARRAAARDGLEPTTSLRVRAVSKIGTAVVFSRGPARAAKAVPAAAHGAVACSNRRGAPRRVTWSPAHEAVRLDAAAGAPWRPCACSAPSSRACSSSLVAAAAAGTPVGAGRRRRGAPCVLARPSGRPPTAQTATHRPRTAVSRRPRRAVPA